MSHVLVVDDDSNTHEALAAIAQAEGFTAATAGSVAEARIQLVGTLIEHDEQSMSTR